MNWADALVPARAARPDTMKADDLLLLAEVQRAGSLSAASRVLALPKATLSRRLAALEGAMEFRLFVRGGKTLQLTELGEQLADRAAVLAADIAETRQWLTCRNAPPRGQVRIALSADLEGNAVASLLAGFCERYPEVELELVTASEAGGLPAEPGAVAVIVGAASWPNVVARQLCLFEPALFASPQYARKHGWPLATGELGHHRFVLTSTLAESRTLHLACDEQVELVRCKTPPTMTDSSSMALGLVQAGAGMGFFSPRLVEPLLASGQLVRVLPDWRLAPRPVHVVTHRKQFLPTKTQAVVDYLFETLGRSGF